MANKPVIARLHDRITITLSAKVTRLVRAEIRRQEREGDVPQTAEEIVEEGTTFVCEAMARPWRDGAA